MAELGVDFGYRIGAALTALHGAHTRRRHVFEVAPGAEMPARAAQDQHADGTLAACGAFGLGQRLAQLAHHGQRHGVAHLGSIQGNFEHSARIQCGSSY